jgi:hypothetical protein
VLYVEVSYSVSDGRAHKAREGKRYRLKERSKQIAQDCIVNVLQFKADKKGRQIDSLHIQILRKDRLIEKKDKLIEGLYTEMDKLRQMMLPPVVCAPLPMVEERYDAMVGPSQSLAKPQVEERCEAMVGPSQILEEPPAGEKRCINQMETDALDLFFESLG